jgi:hypothetical protein
MLQIHPNARTTPAVRAEIARSGELWPRAGPVPMPMLEVVS